MQLRKTIVALSMLAAASGVLAQAQKQEYTPQVGQSGKDVIWVPTPEALVDRMLNMAKVTASDVVYDLGSGDGRTVIMAAKKFGATALGIEYNPDMVTLSERNAAREGVTAKAKFMKADIFETDLSKATVITMYLLPDLNLRLRPRILDLKPGTRVVSHAFTMGDWDPDERAEVEGRSAMLWIVPAKVNGNWVLKGPSASYELMLSQQYQRLYGTARAGAATAQIEDGKVNGESVSFVINEGGRKQRFVGRVAGASLVGALDGSGVAQTGWTATRSR